MSEVTSGVPSGAGQGCNPVTRACVKCGRKAKKITRKMCRTCYMRAWRGGGIARREPLDPEIAALLLPVPGTSESFAERVFTYVDATGDCWEWTGALDRKGYGVIGRGGRGSGNMPAHCAVWSLIVGAIPPGMQYDHLCRRHTCVSPAHAEIVTAAINKERGESPAARYARRKTCDSGHPLDGRARDSKTDKYVRYCKTCARGKSLKRYYDLKATQPPRSPQTGEDVPQSA